MLNRTELDRYHVLTVKSPTGQGWTSIHRSYDGAEERLDKIVSEWGLDELYATNELEYGIGHLPVED